MAKIVKIVSLVSVLWTVVYVSHLPDRIGLTIAPLRHQAIFLGLLLFLTFLIYPAKRESPGVKWYDWILIVMGLVPTAYIVLFYEMWQIHGGTEPESYEKILFIVLLIALIEALRRSIGIILSVLTFIFAFYPMICHHLPGILSGRGYSLERITSPSSSASIRN